jgi:hypothetical protein
MGLWKLATAWTYRCSLKSSNHPERSEPGSASLPPSTPQPAKKAGALLPDAVSKTFARIIPMKATEASHRSKSGHNTLSKYMEPMDPGGSLTSSTSIRILRPAFWRMVGYPSGQRGQTVNLLAYAFDGSNPSPTTIFRQIIPGGIRSRTTRHDVALRTSCHLVQKLWGFRHTPCPIAVLSVASRRRTLPP